MELVCPLCNSLGEIELNCDICNKPMVDFGPVINFLDDYSPYLPLEVSMHVDGTDPEKCLHIFKCNNCNTDKRVEIKRILI